MWIFALLVVSHLLCAVGGALVYRRHRNSVERLVDATKGL